MRWRRRRRAVSYGPLWSVRKRRIGRVGLGEMASTAWMRHADVTVVPFGRYSRKCEFPKKKIEHGLSTIVNDC